MRLSSVRLGDCLTLVERRNFDERYGVDDVRGVNNQKLMIRTKADVSARDFSKFQIVEPGEFFFNHRTSRNGSKLSITYNYDNEPHIVTEDYVVFKVTDEDYLCPGWLYLYVCRTEYDRYAIQNSWGSSTEFFNWEDLCDTEIDLPPIEIQRKYAAIYETILANQRSYEHSLDDLSISCALLLDKCKQATRWEPIGNFLKEIDIRNKNGICKYAQGVNLAKQFVESKASSSDLKKYKLVKSGQLACNFLHVGRDIAYPVAINESDEIYAVSPAYAVFEPDDSYISHYLLAWLSRDEVGRFGWFICDDSIRGSMNVARFLSQKVPVPDRELIKAVSELSIAFRNRQVINERLKSQLKDICPVLIRGSVEEASR